ncbi:MAG: hypothetical protein KDK51_10705, partial [Deltaproteobacteria bacterium]|nr:hypothetical protein [Deltaproteobacteria bacterium]
MRFVYNILPLICFFTSFLHVFNAFAWQVDSIYGDTAYYDDTPSLPAVYIGYKITNDTGSAVNDVWVTIDDIAGTNLTQLAANESGEYHIGTMANNAVEYVYFYLLTSGAATGETHNIKVYDEKPTVSSTPVHTEAITMDTEDTQQTNTNKVTVIANGPNPPFLGGILEIQVTGSTGNISASQILYYTPAVDASWPADTFQLIDVSIEFDDGISVYTYDDYLKIPNSPSIPFSSADYVATYHFQLIKTNNSTTTVNPSAYIHTGQVKHTGSYPTTIPPIPSVSNNVTLAKSVDQASLPGTGGTVTYTVAITNPNEDDLINGYEGDITLDYIQDTLPAGTSYVANSSYFGPPGGEVSISDPLTSGSTITWAQTFTVPEAVSAIIPTTYNLLYDVSIPGTAGTYTNSVIGFIGTEQIDTSTDTASSDPATVTVTVGATAGFTVTESGGSTSLGENAGTDTFTVVLDAQPTLPVVINVSSSDTGAATVSSSSLTFTSANWNTPQTITVTGVNDADLANESVTITLSVDDVLSDDAYDPLADQTVTALVIDDDSAGFTVTESGGSTSLGESGGTDTFTVVLDAQPSSDVVIT